MARLASKVYSEDNLSLNDFFTELSQDSKNGQSERSSAI